MVCCLLSAAVLAFVTRLFRRRGPATEESLPPRAVRPGPSRASLEPVAH